MRVEAAMGEIESQLDIRFGSGELRDEAAAGEALLEQLYDQYSLPLYRYALALTSSADDAEDAVQEVFARVAREAGRLRRVGDIRAYLFTAARNAAFTLLRSRRRRSELQEAAQSVFRSELESGGPPVESAALCEALAGLPVEQREVLVLKVYDEMTFEEIAAVLGVSHNTAASRYRYGVAKLRQALEVNQDG